MDRQWLIGAVLLVAISSSAVSAQPGIEVQDAEDLGAMEGFLLSLKLLYAPSAAAEEAAPLYAYSYEVICGDGWDNVAALNPEHGGLAAVVFYHGDVPRAQYYPTIYAARHAACRQGGSPGQRPAGDSNASMWTADSVSSPHIGQPPSGDSNAYIATTFPLIGHEAERRFLVRGRERVPAGWAEPAR